MNSMRFLPEEVFISMDTNLRPLIVSNEQEKDSWFLCVFLFDPKALSMVKIPMRIHFEDLYKKLQGSHLNGLAICQFVTKKLAWDFVDFKDLIIQNPAMN